MKEHIKKTAVMLFAERGFHATSIISISQQAGISKGLIFHYFENKEHLFRDLLFDGLQDLRNQFLFNGETDVIDLDMFYERYYKFLIKNTDFVKIFLSVIINTRLSKLYKNEIQFTIRIILNQFKQSQEVNGNLLFSFCVGLSLNFVTNRLTTKNLQEIFTMPVLTKLN